MKSRLFPWIMVIAIFVVGVGLGRYVILPALRGTGTSSASNNSASQRMAASFASPVKPRAQSMFDECMTELLERRSDPLEARNVCNVITQSLE